MRAGVRARGFTIIEVTLFLAIVSALTAGILVTSSVSINNQRYIDAVQSFKALVQEQFVNATRVQNPNDETGSACAAEPAAPRGTHDCLLVGKILSVTNGNTITIRNIVATPPADDAYPSTLPPPPLPFLPPGEIDDIKSMTNISAVDVGSDTLDSQWDTIIKMPSPCASPCNVFSLVVIRSPTTGTLYSFFKGSHDLATEASPDDLNTYIHSLAALPSPTSTSRVCIDPNGLAIWKQEITLHHGVAGPNGVVESEAAPGC